MTDEDIKRMVVCREAIDKHRAFNRARVEALETSTSVADAKSIIETKLGKATTITVDTSVKPTQEIKSILEEERTKSTLEMNAVIESQGFESVSDFRTWYDKFLLEIVESTYPMTGTCDLCGEKEITDQPCVKLYGKNTCVFSGTYEKDKGHYIEAIKRLREGITEIVNGIIYPISPCKDGHGYQHDYKNYKEFPIPEWWRI